MRFSSVDPPGFAAPDPVVPYGGKRTLVDRKARDLAYAWLIRDGDEQHPFEHVDEGPLADAWPYVARTSPSRCGTTGSQPPDPDSGVSEHHHGTFDVLLDGGEVLDEQRAELRHSAADGSANQHERRSGGAGTGKQSAEVCVGCEHSDAAASARISGSAAAARPCSRT